MLDCSAAIFGGPIASYYFRNGRCAIWPGARYRAICLAATLIGSYALTEGYMRSIAADAATADAGISYLCWFLPGLKLEHVWYLSVASVATQVIISLVLLHRLMRSKLN